MSRRCGTSKPTPTPLNGEATKPTRHVKEREREDGLASRGRNKSSSSAIAMPPATGRGRGSFMEKRKVNTKNKGIKRMENLSSCTNIRTLKLCGNQIREICGLEGLLSLERLDLSSNRIKRIGNMEHLASLQSLDLKGNQIENVDDVKTLSPLPNLRRFFLQGYQGDKKNPACQHPSYYSIVTRLLPRLDMLDGESLNLRKCMVDAVLDNAKPNDEALKSPRRERWCKGLDWTPEAVDAATEEDLRVELDAIRDLLHDCSSLNRRAGDALKEF